MEHIYNIETYKIISKIYIGTTLKITFQHQNNPHDQKVLEFTELIACKDLLKEDSLFAIRIMDETSYTHDLSLQLKRPEVIKYLEAIIFINQEKSTFTFRGCAKHIVFH